MTIALVTGTSSGMGMHAAVALAKAGHTVVGTMRDPSRDEAVRAAADEAGVQVQVRRLDVTDLDSVQPFVEGVMPTSGRSTSSSTTRGRAWWLPPSSSAWTRSRLSWRSTTSVRWR